MGSCVPPATTHHLQRHRLWLNSTTVYPPLFTSLAPLYNHSRLTSNHIPIHSSTGHLHRSFPLSTSSPSSWSGRCSATSPGPPTPQKMDPPPGDSPPPPSSGVMSRFSRVQDTMRIFLAVLFWMSLFFWSCVWDGRNDGRPKNRSRFRR